MRPRFLALALLLVVLPTAWLTFLAARAIRDRDLAVQRGTARAAAAALEEIDRAVQGQLGRDLELVRVAVSASLAAGGSVESLDEAARRLRSRPLIGAIHVFMNPWGFVYPPDAPQAPMTPEAASALPVSPPASPLADVLRREIASLPDPAQPVVFVLNKRPYAFVLLKERKSLCAGFEVNEEALQQVLLPLLQAYSTRLFTVVVDAPGLPRVAPELPRASGGADDEVVMTDSLSSRRENLAAAGPAAAVPLLIVARPLGAPFGAVMLRAFAGAGEGARAGALQVRLYVWGIVLLATGILAGVGVVLAGAATEVRRARRQSDFMAGISHDLRTPLASIRMLAESLSIGSVREAERGRFLNLIVQESDRMAKLVDRVLFLVRFAQGPFVTARRRLDARRVVDQAADVFLRGKSEYGRWEVEGGRCLVLGVREARERAEGGGRPRATSASPDRPSSPSGVLGLPEKGATSASAESPADSEVCEVEGDEAALMQVLLNLFDNAAKYGRTAAGAVDIGVRVEKVVARRWVFAPARRCVRIAVQDAGPGISRRDLKRIFDRFYRGAGAQALNVSGTGLGLAVCRHVVRAHGGWLTVASEVGKGSTFSVFLPAVGEETTGPQDHEIGRTMA